MKYAMIGTWRMAQDGVVAALPSLAQGGIAGDAVEQAIMTIEDYPYFKSVGYGGLPNEHGIVEMDSAFMNGDNFQLGAVGGVRNIANPIKLSRLLSQQRVNNVLVGAGAEEFADEHLLPRKGMLSARAKKRWDKKVDQVKQGGRLTPYDGHDTVGMLALDRSGSMAVGTSTSGLFMKHAGRVGDSPLAGNGFYVDSQVGGAAATGLGEDMMKRPLCFEIVQAMERGANVQTAVDQTVYPFIEKLGQRNGQVGEFSYVAMDNQGNYAIATNVEFSFAVGNEYLKPTVYVAIPGELGKVEIKPATQAWLDAYLARVQAEVK
ncbi:MULTISPECIES: N(4)-(beta-N-acetylglucosaminyl)-L-asparaginase [Lactiplantibacillus]|uniref:N(4)-(Beta-N-acetylglucosaminyl)-L-asparaginase n=2 Tax=Lactiplantibacillus TaxID=2767842 RepID=A0ABW1R530_9LACO|nr:MULTISPECIES: N(4)-(beta-N-acetylglucosaminyl)-L-asparaginase [Lactiplantibacillus]